jgi:hypothetical protein
LIDQALHVTAGRAVGIAVGQEDKFLRPGPRQGRGKILGKTQCVGDIGFGFQGVHEKEPPDNRFHIAYPLNPAGYFQPGTPGK